MPARKGLLAPQNTFLDTIATRFDGTHSNFVLGNAKITKIYPIVYCSDGFCELTSYSRAQIMQKSCACNFLYGQKTDVQHRDAISSALNQKQELKLEVILYRSTGTPFWCLLDIVPIQDEKHEVVLFLCSYKDITKQKLHEQKQAQLHQQQQLQQLQHLHENALGHHHHHQQDQDADEKSEQPNDDNYQANFQQLNQQQQQDQSAGNHALDLEHGGHTDQQALISMEEFQLDENDANLDDLDLEDEQEGGHHAGDHDKQTASQYSRRRSRAVLYQLSGHYGGADRRSVNMKSKLKLNNRMTIPEYKTTTIEKQRFIVSHYGLGKSCWDWLILIVSFYVAIVVPYNATFKEKRRWQHFDESNDDFFQQQQQQSSSNFNSTPPIFPIYSNASLASLPTDDPECEIDLIDIFVEVVFLIDVILNFRTTFVNRKGEVVTRPKIICKHYVRGWFIVDACAALPFDLLCGFNLYSRSRLSIDLNLLKLIRLLRLARLLQKMDRYSQYSYIILTLLMLIFSLLAHWCACIWYVIAMEEIDSHPPEWKLGWIHQLSDKLGYNVVNATDMASSYVTALYFTTSSLTSVGFGNVSANTNAEKVFSIVIMLIGALMHAVVFGNVTALIRVMYARRSNYQTRLRDLKDFFRLHQLPKDLQQRMSDYFQTTWSLNHGIETYEILKDFPEELCGDVSLHLHREVLSLPIFGSAPQGFLKSLARHIESKFCCPTEYLIHRGDALCYLYLVCNGSMEVLQDNMVVGILGKGDLVGYDVNAVLTPEHTQFAGLSKSGLSSSILGLVKSSSDLKALTYCDLKCIHIGGLLEVLKLYPEFSDTFHEEIIHDLSFNLREQHEEQADDDDDEDEEDDDEDNQADNDDLNHEEDDEDDDDDDEEQQPPPPSRGNNGNGQGRRSPPPPPPSSGANRQHMGRLFRSITENGGQMDSAEEEATADDGPIGRFNDRDDEDDDEEQEDELSVGKTEADGDEEAQLDRVEQEEQGKQFMPLSPTDKDSIEGLHQRRQRARKLKDSNGGKAPESVELRNFENWPDQRTAPAGGGTAPCSLDTDGSASCVVGFRQPSDDLMDAAGESYDDAEDDDEVGEVSSLLTETEQLIARRKRNADAVGMGINRRRHEAFVRDSDDWQKFSHSYDGLTQCSSTAGRKLGRPNAVANPLQQRQHTVAVLNYKRPDLQQPENHCSNETIMSDNYNGLQQQPPSAHSRRAPTARANSSSQIVAARSSPLTARQLRPVIGNAVGGRPKPPLSFDLSRNTTAIVDRRRRSAGCIQRPLSLVGNQQQVDSQLAMRQQNRCHSSLTHINENEQSATAAAANQRPTKTNPSSAAIGRSRRAAKLGDEQRVNSSSSDQVGNCSTSRMSARQKQLKTSDSNTLRSSYSNQDLEQIDAHITASVRQLRQEFREELSNAVELLTRLVVERDLRNPSTGWPPRRSRTNLSTSSLNTIGSSGRNNSARKSVKDNSFARAHSVQKDIHSAGHVGGGATQSMANPRAASSAGISRSISSVNFAPKNEQPNQQHTKGSHEFQGGAGLQAAGKQAIVSMVNPTAAHWPLSASNSSATSTKIVKPTQRAQRETPTGNQSTTGSSSSAVARQSQAQQQMQQVAGTMATLVIGNSDNDSGRSSSSVNSSNWPSLIRPGISTDQQVPIHPQRQLAQTGSGGRSATILLKGDGVGESGDPTGGRDDGTTSSGPGHSYLPIDKDESYGGVDKI